MDSRWSPGCISIENTGIDSIYTILIFTIPLFHLFDCTEILTTNRPFPPSVPSCHTTKLEEITDRFLFALEAWSDNTSW